MLRRGRTSTEPRPLGLGPDPGDLTVPFQPERRDDGVATTARPIPVDATGVSTRTIVLQALAFAAVTRVALMVIAWWSLRIFGKRELYPAQLPDRFIPGSTILDGWARWDIAHYVAVARLGYGDDNPSHDGGLGFFPVFPMLMRGATEIAGVAPSERNLAIAAILIANLCFAGCVALIAAMSARWGPEFARNTTVIFCLSPFAFFFNVAYTESLFLLLSLGALTLNERRKVWPATVLAAAASGTRLVGLALTPALLWSAWKRGASRRELAGILIISPLGTLAYFAYTAVRFDDPLAYFTAQSNWGGWDEHVRFYAELFLRQPKEAIGGDPRHLVIVLNVALGFLALGLLTQMRRVVDPGLMVFTILLVVVQFAFTWVSLGRYLLPAAGLYFAFAALFARSALRGWPRDAVLAVSTMLLAFLTALFAHGFWVV
jgi:hypothetical protein